METMWIVAIAAVVVGAVAGFFIGRSTGGSKERITELETEVSRHKEEIAEYKKEVETHFDKTATLFVDMAGSYKALFEHLSADYEKLSEGSARELFKERVSAMLLEGEASGERKAIADGTVNAAPAEKPAEAGVSSDDEKAATKQAGDEKPAAPASADKAEDPPAAKSEAAEQKPVAEEGAGVPEPSAGGQKADAAEGDKPAAEVEKPAKPETGEASKAVEPEAAAPQGEDKPAGDDNESTLERAAKKRAESAATEGGAKGKGS